MPAQASRSRPRCDGHPMGARGRLEPGGILGSPGAIAMERAARRDVARAPASPRSRDALPLPSSGRSMSCYQGDLTDPVTKQVDMGRRWYTPGMGRFSSRDVIFGEPSDPMTLNQFAYGRMNPATMYDPTGMGQCSMVHECTTQSHGHTVAVGGNPGVPSGQGHGEHVYSPPPPPIIEFRPPPFTTPADRVSAKQHYDTWVDQQPRSADLS